MEKNELNTRIWLFIFRIMMYGLIGYILIYNIFLLPVNIYGPIQLVYMVVGMSACFFIYLLDCSIRSYILSKYSKKPQTIGFALLVFMRSIKPILICLVGGLAMVVFSTMVAIVLFG